MRHCAISLAVLMSLFPGGAASKSVGQSPDQKEALQLLKSREWRERDKGIQMLRLIPSNRLAPPVRKRLVDLLQTETDQLWLHLEGRLPPPKHKGLTQEQYEEGAGEWRAEYLSYLFGLVMHLHDPSTVPLLLAADPQPCDADLEMARYGATILPSVSSRLRFLEPFRAGPGGFEGAALQPEMAMADILTKMMTLDQQKQLNPHLTPSNYASIRQMLRPLLQSPDRFVRLYAGAALSRAGDARDAARFRATFLSFLDDPIPGARTQGLEGMLSMTDVRAIPLAKVRELAASDPYHYRQGVLGNGPTVYPVRDAARKVLKKFSKLPIPAAPG